MYTGSQSIGNLPPSARERSSGGSGTVGLSIAHISPLASRSPQAAPTATLKYAVGGTVARLTGPRLSAPPPAGRRGTIRLFSKGSQRRLRVLLASLNQQACAYLPLLITLTYPREWSPDPRDWKRHLDSFSKRLARTYPKAAAVWVIEFQKRGAPHFHLLVVGVPKIEKSWLSRAWYEVVGSKDARHLRAGTQIDQARSWRALQGYITKYVSKQESKQLNIPEGIGRWWGVLNREQFATFVEWREKTLSLPTFYKLRRIFKRYLRARGVRFKRYRSTLAGLLVYMPASEVVRLL